MKNSTFSISLSPFHTLSFTTHEKSPPKALNRLASAFKEDWRLGLFTIASEKPADTNTVLRFWYEIAASYLTHLCHSYQEKEPCAAGDFDQDKLVQWVAGAPPMEGGEYFM